MDPGSSWNSAQQCGSFTVRQNETAVQCIVPFETLIDRFATNLSAPEETFGYHRKELKAVALMLIKRGFGRGGRIVLRGIDFLALP
jgi:hypothetical protein